MKDAANSPLSIVNSPLPSGYKQTEVGVIPEDWEVKRLWDVAEADSENLGADTRLDMTFKYIALEDVDEGALRSYSEQEFRTAPSRARRRLRKLDVLVSTVRPNLKSHLLFSMESDEWVCSTGFCVVRCKNGISHPGYVYFHMFAGCVTRQIEALLSGSNYPAINGGDIGALKIPFPIEYEEQEAIAEALSDADALIEALEQLLTKKRQLKQGAMQELLTGKKRLPGFSGEWRTRQIGEVINHCSSGATPYRGRPDYYKGTVKWITSGELNYSLITDTIEHISEEAVEKTNLKVHPVGTFLMAITGLEAAGTRGACGIVGSPATTNQSCMAIYPTPELKTEFLYHYYVLRGNELALRYCQGTKQQSYTAKLVRLLPIDLPPTLEEQVAIVEVLSDISALISALEAKLAKARQLKQGMMQELLTGRIRLGCRAGVST